VTGLAYPTGGILETPEKLGSIDQTNLLKSGSSGKTIFGSAGSHAQVNRSIPSANWVERGIQKMHIEHAIIRLNGKINLKFGQLFFDYFDLYLIREKKMLSTFNKYIIRSSAIVLIIVTLLQLISSRLQFTSNDQKNPNNNETILVVSNQIQSSPCKTENNVKGFDRSSGSETSLLKILGQEKILYSEDVARNSNIKLLYTIKILNEINILKFTTNHLDLRSPPISFS
jgi:hypothetical protein